MDTSGTISKKRNEWEQNVLFLTCKSEKQSLPVFQILECKLFLLASQIRIPKINHDNVNVIVLQSLLSGGENFLSYLSSFQSYYGIMKEISSSKIIK